MFSGNRIFSWLTRPSAFALLGARAIGLLAYAELRARKANLAGDGDGRTCLPL
jgi:hypothetical protein